MGYKIDKNLTQKDVKEYLDKLEKELTNSFIIINNRLIFLTTVTGTSYFYSYRSSAYLQLRGIDIQDLGRKSWTETSRLGSSIGFYSFDSYRIKFTRIPTHLIDAQWYKELYEANQNKKLSKEKRERFDKLPHPILFTNTNGLKL